MIGWAEMAAVLVMAVVAVAEAIHGRRIARLSRLAFGPSRGPSPWVGLVPAARVLASGAAAWGMGTLLLLPPKTHRSEAIPDEKKGHLLMVLDVSPSMRLKDAGPEKKQQRMERAREVMQSFFDRVPIEQYLLSVVAVYNGAKPVVLDTNDMEVVRNILGDLPMHHAFPVGKTDIFAGLEEGAKAAAPWQPRSTVLVLISDGDTVPTTGMPKLPASIREVLVVGVGDPRAGTFIDGRQSRQDAGTLRQVAARLGGTYHDANEKHLPSELLNRLTNAGRKSPWEQLGLREYALMACVAGSSVLAFVPLLLHRFGTRWMPGVPASYDRARERPRAAVEV